MLWQLRRGLIPQVASLAAGSGGGPTDPNFSSVVLLAGFNGTNGATSFSDESGHAHGAATFSNSAQLSTSQIKFGSASLQLASATTDSISWPDSTDFQFTNGLFTVECWIYPTTTTNSWIVAQWEQSVAQSWRLTNNSGTLVWAVSTTGTNTFTDLSGGSLTNNVWHHIAVDYDGSTYRLYLDGNCTATSSTGRTIYASAAQPLVISGDPLNSNKFYNGYVDELRITKGVARYASSTTYTVPVAAFPRS